MKMKGEPVPAGKPPERERHATLGTCYKFILTDQRTSTTLGPIMFGFGRLSHLAFDLIAISALVAGVKKSTGFA